MAKALKTHGLQVFFVCYAVPCHWHCKQLYNCTFLLVYLPVLACIIVFLQGIKGLFS